MKKATSIIHHLSFENHAVKSFRMECTIKEIIFDQTVFKQLLNIN
jgi:hypothetical protein